MLADLRWREARGRPFNGPEVPHCALAIWIQQEKQRRAVPWIRETRPLNSRMRQIYRQPTIPVVKRVLAHQMVSIRRERGDFAEHFPLQIVLRSVHPAEE